MGRNPVPFLLALATASNIGSTATITGNPQNILIGSVSHIWLSRLPSASRSHRDHRHYFSTGWCFVVVPQTIGGKDSPVDGTAPTGRSGSLYACTPLIIAFGIVARISRRLESCAGRGMRSRPPLAGALAPDTADLSRGGLVALGFVCRTLPHHRRRPEHRHRGHSSAYRRALNLHNLAVFSFAVTLLSNLVSNVPAVMLLKGLVPQFQNAHQFWLALAMASTLAGNLTITGSIANIIVVETVRPAGADQLQRLPCGRRSHYNSYYRRGSNVWIAFFAR